MGQHIDEIDADWVGACNYRRSFRLDAIGDINPDTIVCSAVKLKYQDFVTYTLFHNIDDYLMLLLQKQLKISDKLIILNQMTSKVMLWKNIFFMHKTAFKKYFEYASRVLEALIAVKPKLDLDSRDFY